MKENHLRIPKEGDPVNFETLIQPHLTSAFRVAFLSVHQGSSH